MPKEKYSPKAELEPTLVHAYAATFIPRLDLYPWQQPDGSYITIHKPLDSHLIIGHLLGHITIGAYALDQQDMAKWICFDADEDEHWQGLLSLATDLEQQGIIPYLEPSRRGGHLWLFLDPLSGTFARRFGNYLLAEHNLSGVELYPKQDFLNPGPGSLVRLPLGVHRKTGRKYHFITRDGQALAPTFREQIRVLSTPERVPMPFIMRILAKTLPTASTASAPPPSKPSPELRPTAPSSGHTLSERLKSRISVLEFVSQYVELDASQTGFCPFHDDQQKSFGVNVEGNYWNCFAGCGGGSIIDFWMKWREKHGQDPSFIATVKELRGMLF
jgi:CHC2 zinc finger